MLSETKRKFLFKCEECEMIIVISIDDPDDLQDIQDDKMFLECPCGAYCKVLRD